MSQHERKAAYENSALKDLVEQSGHRICTRCYCCDMTSESAPCYQCGGFEDESDDDGWGDFCAVCDGEGEIYWQVCIGDCDDEGNHKTSKPTAGEGPIPPELAQGDKA